VSRRKKYRADGGFVMVTRQLTRSAAYRSLTPRAGWLLHGLMDRYQGDDNRVSMSTREAATWLKSGLHQVAKAFDELEDKGFIRCHERGGFTRKVRHATTWTLTMYGRAGQKGTLDFLSWRPGGAASEFKTRMPGRHQYGCQDGINRQPIDAAAASVAHIHGCQDGINTDAGAASHIESTMVGRPRTNGPVGNREARAAWLRSWLKSGYLTPDAVASALDIQSAAVEDIASGKVGLANTSWEKVAQLVAGRLN
jgi:hypothetical protein